jgi:hypothetical protein
MKLIGWEKANSAEDYRKMIEAEYTRLRLERSSVIDSGGSGAGLEEVRLRLFLSLLDKPVMAKNANDSQYGNALLYNNETPSDQAA